MTRADSFLATGADKWGDFKEHPWTIGWQPSYVTESQIYAKYILQQKSDAKVGILYQNDDFGKDYLRGMRDVLKDRYETMVTSTSYEVTDATIDSQLVSLQSAGVDVLMTVAVPKFAAQSIRKLADMNWKPLHILSNVSASVGTVMIPAGPDNGIGIVSSVAGKDPTDPAWESDPGMKQLPGGKVNTSPTNYRPIRQLQLMRWGGKTWERFGDIIEGMTT
jgi:branched-chain amino acid transport system substrate-binding protein